MARRLRLLAVAALVLACPPGAVAQTYTWTGASGIAGLWTLSGNWSGGVPAAGGTALFNAATPFQAVFLGTTNPIDTLRFSSGSASYTLLGGTLNTQGSNLIEVTAGTTADQSILGDLVLGGGGTLRNDGSGLLLLNTATMPGAVAVDGSGAVTVTGAMTGAGSVAKSGGGTLTLANAANSYSGGTTISGGTLIVGTLADLGANSGVGTGGISLSGGTFQYSGGPVSVNRGLTLTGAGAVNVATAGATLTLGGAVTGSGSLTRTGGGALVLSNAANTYTGATVISGGVLSVSSLANGGANSGIGASSSAGGNLVLDDGTLRYTGAGASTDRVFQLGGVGGTLDASGTGLLDFASSDLILGSGVGSRVLTLTGSGDGRLRPSLAFGGTDNFSVVKSGTGTWSLEGYSNNYHGGTTVLEGTLRRFGFYALPFYRAYTVHGGVLESTRPGDNLPMGSLSGTGGEVRMGSNWLEVNQDVNTTYAGFISGTNYFSKKGTGTLTLTGANTYTGGTLVFSGGTLQLGDGTTTGSVVGNVNLDGTLALNPGADGLTLDGNITQIGTVTKLGANTATLTGTNTYAGGTTVSAGTVQVGNGGTTGSVVGDVTNAGTLAFNRSDDLTFGGAISGTGNVTKLGAGTLTLSNAASSYTGVTTLAGGVVSVSTLSTAGAASPIGAANNDIDKLVFDGGTLRFASTSSTPTIIGRRFTVGPNGGTLEVADGDLRFGGDSIITPSGTGARTFTLNVAAGAATEIRSDYLYEVGDTSTGVTKTGAGAAGLSGFYLWTNTGPIQVNQGTLHLVGRSTNSGVSSAVTVAGGATLSVNDNGGSGFRIGSLAGAGTVQSATDGSANLLWVGGNNGSTEFSGLLRDGNTANGSIAQVLKVGAGTWTLSGANTYTGSTQIDFGVVSVASLADGGVASGIGASSNAAANLQLTGGTLRYTGTGASTDRLFQLHGGTSALDSSGTGALHFTNTGAVGFGGIGSRTLTLTGSADGSLAPSLGGSGSVSLTKTGPGTWTLTGANTYTGATAIDGGTLRVNGSLAAGSAVSVANGATLGGTGTVGGTVTVASGATVAPGNSVGTLTVGGLSLTNGSHLAFEIGSAVPTNADLLAVTGAATTAGGGDTIAVFLSGTATGFTAGTPVTYTLLTVGGTTNLTTANFALDTAGFAADLPGTWTHAFAGGGLSATFTPVPEPASVLGLGVLGVGVAGRVRRRRTTA